MRKPKLNSRFCGQRHLHFVDDLHLDAAVGKVRAQLEGLFGLGKGEDVRDERLDVEDSAANC